MKQAIDMSPVKKSLNRRSLGLVTTPAMNQLTTPRKMLEGGSFNTPNSNMRLPLMNMEERINLIRQALMSRLR